MPDNAVMLAGNATRDAELTFAGSGMAITSFGLAYNTRKQVNGEWEDGDPQFFDVKVFGKMAENVAESIRKGMRVSVTGRLQQSSWEKDGERKSKIEIVADTVAPDLKWVTAEVTKSS